MLAAGKIQRIEHLGIRNCAPSGPFQLHVDEAHVESRVVDHQRGITNELQKRGVSDSELESIIQFDSMAGLDRIEYDPYENEP